MRHFVTGIWLTGLLACWLGTAAAESSRVTERAHDLYRQVRKAGLADLPIDASATKYELAVAVATALERLKARAWNDSATETQKLDALQAMQQLVADCRSDLQRLNTSIKAAQTLIAQELQRLGMEVPATSPGNRAADPVRPRVAATRPRLPAPAPGTDSLPNALKVNALVSPLLAPPPRGSVLELSGNDQSEAFLLNARAALAPALDLSTTVTRLRANGDRASRSHVSYSPGLLTLTGSFSNVSRNPLANAMVGLAPEALPFGFTSFGGEAVVRGPLGLSAGAGLEGIQGLDTDLMGRYSTKVGFQAGQRLSLSLDLKRSAYLFDPTSATYSANVGLGFNPSRHLAFQLRYQMSEYDWRTFGLRESGLQGFVAGQVAIRW